MRAGALDRVHLALDYFDASINRVGAWVVGARAVLKGLLYGLLLPIDKICAAEAAGRGFERLALREEGKGLPLGAVWDAYCLRQGAPAGPDWIEEVSRYEKDVLSARA